MLPRFPCKKRTLVQLAVTTLVVITCFCFFAVDSFYHLHRFISLHDQVLVDEEILTTSPLIASMVSTSKDHIQLVEDSPFGQHERNVSRESVMISKSAASTNDSYTSYVIKKLHLKSLDPKQALRPGLGPVVNDVLSFKFLIDSYPDKCQYWNEDNHLRRQTDSLLVVVISAPNHFEKRRAIRRHFAAWKDETYRHYIFLVGFVHYNDLTTQQLLVEEKVSFGDIVQVDVVDSYDNLTVKSVAMLYWVYTHCFDTNFVLKMDDDVFVNIRVLNQIFSELQDRKQLYGTKVIKDKPQRSKGNKYYVSSRTWPWSYYPTYLSGGGYFIGRKAILPLLAAAQTTPYFPLEDVYVTGLCAWKANITLSSCSAKKKIYEPFIPEKLDPCFVRSTAMWQTQSLPQFANSKDIANEIFVNGLECRATCKYLRVACY